MIKQAEIDLRLGMETEVDPRITRHPQEIQNFTHAENLGVQSRRFGFLYHVDENEGNFDNSVKADGLDIFYKANGDIYLFVPKGVDLCVQHYDASVPSTTWYKISDFFQSAPDRVRGKSLNDRFWFVDANNVLRWYREYDGTNHIWAISLLDRPNQRITDNAGLTYGYGSSYEDHIDNWQGIDPPGIFRYKQTMGSFDDDYQILEEGNSGAASKLFVCQWNTNDGSAGYGTGLEGFIKGGIPLIIAASDALPSFPTKRQGMLKNTTMYRQWKQFADDPFTVQQEIARLPYDWSNEFTDGADRRTDVELLDNNDQAPTAEYIDVFNKTLFLGKVTKPVGIQPLFDQGFRYDAQLGEKYIVAEKGGRLYVHDGTSWSEHQPAGDTTATWEAVDISRDGQKFIAIASRLYTYTGTEWIQRYPPDPGGTPGAETWSDCGISSDGNKYIVCKKTDVPGDVYTFADEVWTPHDPSTDITGAPGNGNGYVSCAMSADAAEFITCVNVGRVYVYSSGSWAEVRPTGVDENKNWLNCSMSADGTKYMVVVGEADGGGVWVWNGTQWDEHTPGAEEAIDWFGCDMSADGERFIVSTVDPNNGRLYSYDGNSWKEMRPDGDNDYNWKRCCAISGYGNRYIAGWDPAGGVDGRIYTGNNTGANGTWAEVDPTGTPGTYKWYCCSMSKLAEAAPDAGDYDPAFKYRVPIIVTNSDDKIHTGAVIPLKFQTTSGSDHIASPPDAFDNTNWVGAYLTTDLIVSSSGDGGWYEMVFADGDGVTPLGFTKVHTEYVEGAGGIPTTDSVTFMVEIPELQRGDNTIYLYFEDDGLPTDDDPNSAGLAGQPGHYASVYHLPFLYSNHFFLSHFSEADWSDLTNKTMPINQATYSIGKTDPTPSGAGVVIDTSSGGIVYGNESAWVGYNHTTPSSDSDTYLDVDGDNTNFWRFNQNSLPSDMRGRTIVGFYNGSSFVSTSADVLNHNISGGTDELILKYSPDVNALSAIYNTESGGSTTTLTVGIGNLTVDDWVLVFVGIDYKSEKIKAGWYKLDTSGHWSGSTGVIEAYDDERQLHALSDTIGGDYQLTLYGHSAGATTKFDNVHVFNDYLSLNEIKALFLQETYQPNGGRSVLDDIEDLTASTDYINEVVWSKQDRPDAFPAVNFHKIGDEGEPTTGVIGYGNFVYGFTEKKILPMLAKASEDVIAGVEGTYQYELLKDVTRELGGVGCTAPDTLIIGQVLDNPGIMFLSSRGIEFFDGSSPVVISKGISNLITDNFTVTERRAGQMIYHPLKRRLFLGFKDAESWVIVGDTDVLATDPSSVFLWKKWANYTFDYSAVASMTLGNGELLWTSNIAPNDYYLVYIDEGNSPAITDVYNVTGFTVDSPAFIISNIFLVGDGELINGVLETSETLDKLTFYLDGNGTEKINVAVGELWFPAGSNATEFQFKLEQTDTNTIELRKFTFEYDEKEKRRL